MGEFDSNQPVPNLPTVHEVNSEKAQKMYDQRVSTVRVQGNNIRVGGSIVGGDQVNIRPQIDAQGSQGMVVGAQGPITQYLGQQTRTGGGAYIDRRFDTGGGDFVGRDKNTVISRSELAALFAPILQVAYSAPAEKRAEAVLIVEELQNEVANGEKMVEQVAAFEARTSHA